MNDTYEVTALVEDLREELPKAEHVVGGFDVVDENIVTADILDHVATLAESIFPQGTTIQATFAIHKAVPEGEEDRVITLAHMSFTRIHIEDS